MSRLLPHPLLTLMLTAMWLLLQQSIGLGHVLMGLIVGIGASLAMAALQPPKARVRKPMLIGRLIFLVMVDVLRSNLAVSRILLFGSGREHRPLFIEMPLELRDHYALAVLACVITATPGSAWLEYSAEKNTVLIHVLDLVDETQWIETIKGRYETLLLEIFQ